jgi:nitrilase
MIVGAAQASSVWLDRTGTTDKIIDLLAQAGGQDVDLLAFPETFLSGYPFWVMLGGGGRFGDPEHARAYGAYLEAAVELDGPELRRIAEAASDLHVFVALGVSERGRSSGRGTVYCTLVAIDPERGLVGAHRKLNPTHTERLVWGRGDGHGLRTHRVGAVRVGGLNCWENWMPLARHALYADGEELHVAAWPGSAAQTRDITRFIALEGRVYVVLASGLISAQSVPKPFPFYQLIKDKPQGFYNGGSCIVAPDGSWVVEPRAGDEELIVAEIDPSRVAAARSSFDPAGHYARPDVFAVTVDRQRQSAVTFTDEPKGD